MRKKYSLFILCLMLSLFIYLFYRTEKTVINEIAIALISLEQFVALRNCIVKILPLNEHIIYSLPEGLWVFCIAITSTGLYFSLCKIKVSLLFAPIVFSLGLELLQLLHITNGRFDFWDIGLSIFAWIIANYYITNNIKKQNILNPFNYSSGLCIISYLIVFLAHVWR
jgi:hypothetical protein